MFYSKKLNKFKWNTVVGNAEKTNFSIESFDLIIASGLIEYYERDDILLTEINRLLKKNGSLIINVTNNYGYTAILNNLTQPFKDNLIYRFIKKKLFKLEYDSINYLTRKHNIKDFIIFLKNNNYKIIEDRYLGFTILPAPFSSIFNFLTRKLDLKLEKLSNTKLKILGASYIVLCKKI